MRCSGRQPCERCSRRSDECVFANDEARVSVPKRWRARKRFVWHISLTTCHSYLVNLERRARGTLATPAHSRSSTVNDAPTSNNADTAHRATLLESSDTRLSALPTASHPQAVTESGSNLLSSSGPTTNDLRAQDGSSSNVLLDGVQVASGAELTPRNPLVGQDFSYIKDAQGRQRMYLRLRTKLSLYS